MLAAWRGHVDPRAAVDDVRRALARQRVVSRYAARTASSCSARSHAGAAPGAGAPRLVSGPRWLLPLAFALIAVALLPFRPVSDARSAFARFRSLLERRIGMERAYRSLRPCDLECRARGSRRRRFARRSCFPSSGRRATLALCSSRRAPSVRRRRRSVVRASRLAAIALAAVVARASAARGHLRVSRGVRARDRLWTGYQRRCARANCAACVSRGRAGHAADGGCCRVPWRALSRSRSPTSPFGLLAQLGRNRATVAIAFGALATYAIGALLFGLRWPVEYAARLAAHAHAERFGTIQLTPGAIAYGLGVPAAACIAIAAAFGLTAVLALVALSRRIADPFARFAAVAAARAVRHDVLSRARSGRRVRRGGLVRVSHARRGARPRARGDAARGDRLAGPRATPERHRAERTARGGCGVRVRRARLTPRTAFEPRRHWHNRRAVRRCRMAWHDSPRTRLARRTRRVPCRREYFRRRHLGSRTAAHRIARDRTGVGAPANVTVARLRAPQLLRFQKHRERNIAAHVILSGASRSDAQSKDERSVHLLCHPERSIAQRCAVEGRAERAPLMSS